MSCFGKILTLLAKTAIAPETASERSAELAGLINELRALPAATLPKASEVEAELVVTVEAAAGGTAELRARGELTLLDAIPDLFDKAENKNEPAEKAAEALLAYTQKKEGTYLLWLDVPGKPCYCHVSWAWNDNRRQATFRIRDYVHKKLYFGVTAHTDSEGGKWTLERAKQSTAFEVWQSSRKKVRCRGALELPVTEYDKWKSTLEELTRTFDPRPR
jgi:hypothetical protein